MNKHSDLLAALGFVFPEDSNQLHDFNLTYSNHVFKGNEKSINPERILRRIQEEDKTLTNIDHHKRLTLAAEIVYQLLDDRHFGHLKLEKLLYLCKNVKHISFHSNFLKQAMGPHDPKMIRSLDKQFGIKRWFKYNFNSFPKYTPLEKAGEHKEWLNKYYGEDLEDINFILTTFRKFTGDQIELVVTIFDCWKNLIEDGIPPSVKTIAEKVYAWSENKAKFKPEQIKNAISWMKEKQITPS